MNRNFSIILFMCFMAMMLSTQTSTAQVVINEYSASNINTVNDPQGNNSDWVELYNPSAATVTLGGLFLSDDPGNLDKWAIPAGVTIAAGAKKMVFCNDADVVVGQTLCTDFKLTQTHGEWFIISDGVSTIIDSVHLNLTQMNHSRGRTTDGASTWSVFSNPTPNAANTGAYTDYTPSVTMSVAPGFYTASQSVVLSCSDATATIRYTTNGQAPTITSTAYSGPIAVTTTTVIRAAAFPATGSYLKSFEETNTYFINESISPTMNVISMSGNYNNLFNGWGTTNIYSTFEYFDKNHNFKFEMQGETRRHGNDSWAYPQKGMRVYAHDEMGYKNEMPEKFFNTTLRDSFKVLILKAGGSDNFDGGPANATHIRDVFAQTLAEKFHLEMDFRRYEPAVVYLNGQYWGIYEMRERVDNDYTEYNYNQKKKNVDILRYWGGLNVEDGSDTGWVNLYNYIMNNDMSDDNNYAHVTSFLNVKSFAQYFIFNTYLVNTDWLNWNTMWWRGRKGAGVKWRYALWDCDNVLDLGQNYTGMPSTDYTSDPCAPTTLFQNNDNIKHTDMLVALLNNAQFSALYETEFINLLNGPFECTTMMNHLDSLLAIIEPEMPMQCARWGASYNQWLVNVQHLKDQIQGRCTIIADALEDCMDLYPQRLTVITQPPNVGNVSKDGTTLIAPMWSEIIAADSTYNMVATATQPYWVFDHWENINTQNTITASTLTPSISFGFNEEDTLIAVFKYQNLDSVAITFDVAPNASFGSIQLEGVTLPSYPYTTILNKNNTYSLTATPNAPGSTGATNVFTHWSKSQTDSTVLTPDSLKNSIFFTYRISDTIIAHFDSIPLPPPPPPPVADSFLLVPNAFTPNGDGLNEIFDIRYGSDLQSLDVKILNRWGELVWESSDPNKMWDGNQKTGKCDVGVYYYMIKAKFANALYDNERNLQGEVMLVR